MQSGNSAYPPIERRFVAVDGLAVHYRVVGKGPPVVMLHDSPRSSRLHIDTMQRLSHRFRVYALDTPGYGNSQPLAIASPSIQDFAAALGRAIEVLGLERAPLYATHTSAKIALEYAARTGPASGPPRVILDGLSIPSVPASPEFISTYMRPFVIEATGGYLAAEWTRMRDMLRWFPWFDHRPATRMMIDIPGDAWIADYVVDFLSAGPSYSSAYAAAMHYDPKPALHDVKCPVLVAAKPDDVLYGCLDLVPAEQNPALTVQRLSTDRQDWLAWLEASLAEAQAPGITDQTAPHCDGATYVDLPHGQLLVQRTGAGAGPPLLILSAPTTMQALAWAEALPSRMTLVPELPGFGESDALPTPSLEAFADALAAMLSALDIDTADVLATDFAAPLAAHLAMRHPGRIRRVVLNGCFEADAETAAELARRLCPAPVFDNAGGHVLAIWHSLRDAEANWPWYAKDAGAVRSVMPMLEAEALHTALVGILKQPESYGDLAVAACLAGEEKRYPSFRQETLLFDRSDDPGYAGTQALAARLDSARTLECPADRAEAASLIDAFLCAEPAEGLL